MTRGHDFIHHVLYLYNVVQFEWTSARAEGAGVVRLGSGQPEQGQEERKEECHL